VNLTYLGFITKAVADNIRKHPVVNAAVSNDATIFRQEINIGIAVAWTGASSYPSSSTRMNSP
jgi:pyruvate/2-oxoglutarate dehydrogenase complex dihydrolipoamide acyltransferase (E2) component